MQTNKERVGRAHQGVVYLEVAELFNAKGRRQIEHTLGAQSLKGASVSVGRQEQLIRGGPHNAPLLIEGGQHLLGEEMNVLTAEAKELLLFKERTGCTIVGG